MALFGGKQTDARDELRKELLQNLSSHEYLEVLINSLAIEAGKFPAGKSDTGEDIFDGSGDWLVKCQSYYDSRKRVVEIQSDLFAVYWPKEGMHFDPYNGFGIQTFDRELFHETIAYRYTNDGYKPLHSYNGEVYIGMHEVLKCWAEGIKERMHNMFPELEIEKVKVVNDTRASFEYNVPELEWKDWF